MIHLCRSCRRSSRAHVGEELVDKGHDVRLQLVVPAASDECGNAHRAHRIELAEVALKDGEGPLGLGVIEERMEASGNICRTAAEVPHNVVQIVGVLVLAPAIEG